MSAISSHPPLRPRVAALPAGARAAAPCARPPVRPACSTHALSPPAVCASPHAPRAVILTPPRPGRSLFCGVQLLPRSGATRMAPVAALSDQLAAGLGALASAVTGAAASPGPLRALPGSPAPLGASPVAAAAGAAAGVNFALAAPSASSVALCLHTAAGEELLEAAMHRDDASGVWHAFVPGLPPAGVLYAFRVSGHPGKRHRWDPSRPLLDPYARHVAGRAAFGRRDAFEQFQPAVGSVFRGTYDFAAPPFDWGAGYRRPAIAPQDLVILELPVRCFTADASSGLAPARRGTFLGLADKVPHLLEMGVNCVELLPVFEYDELEFQRRPNPRDHMTNVWGYSHLSFFAPMARFSAAEGGGGRAPVAAAEEFKEMVRRLHAAGIEVILDVVYNHTVEGERSVCRGGWGVRGVGGGGCTARLCLRRALALDC